MSDSASGALGRQRRQVAVVTIVAIGIVAVAYWFMTLGPGARIISPPGSTIAQWTDVGDMATDSFTIRDGWQIRWSTSGERLAIAIRGDRNYGTVVDVDEPRTGTTSPSAGGTYHLEVSAEGPWTIAILQGD